MGNLSQVSVSTAKGEVPKSFLRIKMMDCHVRPYDRYSPEGIRTERDEAEREFYVFWTKRVYTDGRWRQDVPFLFNHPFGWRLGENPSNGDYRANTFPLIPEVVCNGGHGHDNSFVPNEAVMRMFILFTEPKGEFDHDSTALIRQAFAHMDGIIDKVDRKTFVRILSPDALGRLLVSLDANQIADLFGEINLYGESMQLDEKFAFALPEHDYKIEELGRYLAVTPYSNQFIQRLARASKKGEELATKLKKYLEQVAKELNRTLESLRGEQHA